MTENEQIMLWSQQKIATEVVSTTLLNHKVTDTFSFEKADMNSIREEIIKEYDTIVNVKNEVRVLAKKYLSLKQGVERCMTAAKEKGIPEEKIEIPDDLLEELKKIVEKLELNNISEEFLNEHIVGTTFDFRLDKDTNLVKLTPSVVVEVLNNILVLRMIDLTAKNEESSALLSQYIDNEKDPRFGTYRTIDDSKHDVVLMKYIEKIEPNLNTGEVDSVYRKLKTRAKFVNKQANGNLIAVNNGVFDFKNKKLLAFDSKYIFLNKITTNFNKNATESPIITDNNDVWEFHEWIKELSCDDEEIANALIQMLNASLRPAIDFDQAVFLIASKGNNGKGTLLRLIHNLLGGTNYCDIALNELENRFGLDRLLRSSVILADENSVGDYIKTSANFKRIVTHDEVTIERKNRDNISIKAYQFMIQCLNDMPRLRDTTESNYRRIFPIPMNANFTGIAKKYIKNDYLARTEVLEYILNYLLTRVDNFTSFTRFDASDRLLSEYIERNNPIVTFANEFLKETSDNRLVWDLIPNKFMYDLYKSWCEKVGVKAVGKNTFNDDLEGLLANNHGDYLFESSGKTQINANGKMNNEEPLINEYKLLDWASNVNWKLRYRGYVRK